MSKPINQSILLVLYKGCTVVQYAGRAACACMQHAPSTPVDVGEALNSGGKMPIYRKICLFRVMQLNRCEAHKCGEALNGGVGKNAAG